MKLFKLELFKLKSVLFFVLFYSLSATIQADIHKTNLPDAFDSSGWDLVVDKNGARIYTIDWPGSDYVALRVVEIMHTSLSNVVGNFIDASTYPEWARDLKESYVVEPFNESRTRKVYTKLGMPWPTSDRDVVFGQKFMQDPETKIVTIQEWYEEDVIPEKPGVVRTLGLNIEFVFVPISKDLTMMIWQGHNEPGGYLPPFVVNWMIKDVFYSSAINLRERLETPAHFKKADWVIDF